MTGFEHLLKSYDAGDELDAMAGSDPPAYLERCFAEGLSSPGLRNGTPGGRTAGSRVPH